MIIPKCFWKCTAIGENKYGVINGPTHFLVMAQLNCFGEGKVFNLLVHKSTHFDLFYLEFFYFVYLRKCKITFFCLLIARVA